MGRGRHAVLAAALTFYAVFILRTSFVALGARWFVLFEDAMISMRYGRNLAAGAGLVWNAGETPIEGYTNFLWTLWMGAVHTLGLPVSKTSLAMMLTGVAILVANALIIERICRRVTAAADARWAPPVAMAVVLFYYPLVFWTLRGMEVGAVSLVLNALVLLALSLEEELSPLRATAMGLLGAAAFLLRSDAALAVGAIALYALLTTRGRSSRVAIGGIVFLCVGGAILGQGAFRYAVYHETLPNTAYLKLMHVPLSARLWRGAFVVLRVLAFHLAVPLAATAAAISVWKREGSLLGPGVERRLALLLAVSFIQVSYAVYVGGDAWEWMLYSNRYVSPAMPVFIVVWVALTAKLAGRVAEDGEARRRAGRVFLGVLALCGCCLLGLNALAHLRPEHGIARTIFPSGSTLLGGAVYLALAIALWLRRHGTGRWLTARLDSLCHEGRFAAGLGLAALVWLPALFHPALTWITHNAAQFDDEARYGRLGLLIAATTRSETRLAVVAAGATPYFSMRPSEDMLGKNDPVIARRPPVGVFSPGHDKWDYHYSLGERHPDIMIERLDTTPAEEGYIASLGFVNLPNGLVVRKDAPGIDRDALGQDYATDAALARALDRAMADRMPQAMETSAP